MKDLLSDEQLCYGIEFEEQYDEEETLVGDVLATSIVIFFTAFALIVSGWCAVILMRGNIQSGGPLEDIFRVVYTAVQSNGIV